MIEIGAGLLLAAVPASAVTFLFGVLLTTPVERALGKWRAWRCWRWASPAGWRAPTRRAGHAPARGAGDLVPRSGYTAQGRPESTAEHTWRLCLMVRLFEDTYPGIDHLHLLKLCVIHDLGEALHGDIPAIHQDPAVDKAIKGRRHVLFTFR